MFRNTKYKCNRATEVDQCSGRATFWGEDLYLIDSVN
jgi:hypothetical protein